MKNRRFIVALITIIFITILIFSIIFFKNLYRYDLHEPKENIASIEIVNIENYLQVRNLYFENIDVVCVIPTEHINSFLNDFFALKYEFYLGDPSYYFEGNAIKISYSSGAFELIGTNCGLYRDSKKNTIYVSRFVNNKEFQEFLHKQIIYEMGSSVS